MPMPMPKAKPIAMLSPAELEKELKYNPFAKFSSLKKIESLEFKPSLPKKDSFPDLGNSLAEEAKMSKKERRLLKQKKALEAR